MRWLLVLSLGACSGGADSIDAAVADDGAVDAAIVCTMTVTGSTTVTVPCSVGIAVHGPHGYDASSFFISSSSPPADFSLRDFSGTFYSPPRSQLNEQLAGPFLTFTGSVVDAGNTYRVSMPPNPAGTFSLSLDPGPFTPPATYASPHGTLDATLVGPAGIATLHATF